jgi:hypothetical protein
MRESGLQVVKEWLDEAGPMAESEAIIPASEEVELGKL